MWNGPIGKGFHERRTSQDGAVISGLIVSHVVV